MWQDSVSSYYIVSSYYSYHYPLISFSYNFNSFVFDRFFVKTSFVYLFYVSQVKKLFEDLRKGYIWLIRQTGWVNPAAKSFLIDKANSVQPYIAYESWIKDAGRVNDYYSDVKIIYLTYLLFI